MIQKKILYSNRSLKEEIYKTSDIKSEFNLMFNKVILPNAARVHDFARDSDHLRLVFIPDKNINISINTATKVVRTTVSNSCTVQKLKVALLHEYSVKVPLGRQVLKIDLGEMMDNEEMPIHWYSVKEGSFLDLDTTTIRLRICDEIGETLQVLVNPVFDTVKDLKHKICSLSQSNLSDFHVSRAVEFLTLFLNVDHGTQFDELDDNKTLIEYNITRKSLIYLLSYTWVNENQISLQLADRVTDQALPKDHLQIKGFSSKSNYSSSTVSRQEDYIVFGDRLYLGCKAGDTLLSVGLRIQEQLGIAYSAQEIAVLNRGPLQKLTVQGCVNSDNMFTVKEGTGLPLKGALQNVTSSTQLIPKTCYMLFVKDSYK